MSGIYLEQEYTIAAGDTEDVSVNATGHLDAGETITTINAVTVFAGPTGSTISSEAANTSTYVDAYTALTVAIGTAVQFRFASTTTVGSYDITYQLTTSLGRVWTRHIWIHAE